MIDKNELRKKFSANPNRYYKVELFDKQGFMRKNCPKCGSYFWTLDYNRTTCPNPPCESYGFIGNPQTKKKLDYIETWRVIEKFFKKEGHKSIPSYPVICRWFPGLYFTVASIVAFQRSTFDKTVFEMPANPLIIPQSCLRFVDIPNVGVTGRHMTNFVMVGQHSLYKKNQGYWKDRCIELDFRLLTEVFGIKPELINFLEDVWVGPSAFGYSLEYFVKGLELGNAVFTEFVGTPENYKLMDQKVIDMGAGLERFTWLSQGTPTCYDVAFGPVIKNLLKICNVDYDKDFFLKYSKLAGALNMDEVSNMKAMRKNIAGKLGVSQKELEQKVLPMEAMYSIADHTRALLFAISDGGLPSNLSGGYNLRVVLRRALSFIGRFKWDVSLGDIAFMHADYLKPMFPELAKNRDKILDVLKIEEERYKKTKERAMKIIESFANKEIPENKLINLYDAEGIPPEDLGVEVPNKFYQKITEKHMSEKPRKEEEIKISWIKPTKILFYDKPKNTKFKAKVLTVINNKYVVLDKTLFYPESGGQEADQGFLITGGKRFEVYDVKKINDVIIHLVKEPKLKEAQEISGEIKWERRDQLMKHHTAIHILNGATRRVLGDHVWQSGSGKSEEKAHLDISHYKSLTEEEIQKIQILMNKVIKKGLRIEKKTLSRKEAEETYGFRIYQGGPILNETLRILDIKDWDIEACGGTHLNNTKEVGKALILSSEKIHDGIVRITIKASKAAEDYLNKMLDIRRELKTLDINVPKLPSNGYKVYKELKRASKVFNISPEQYLPTVKRFVTEILEAQKKLNELEEKSKIQEIKLKIPKSNTLEEFSKNIFEVWKSQRKYIETIRKDLAKKRSSEILKKAKNNKIFDVIPVDRKELIEIANELLEQNPNLTIILANKFGDIIGMSKTKDIPKIIKNLCKKAGGSGGGKGNLAQGKVELSKLLKVIN